MVLFDKSLYMLMPRKITGHYLSKLVKEILRFLIPFLMLRDGSNVFVLRVVGYTRMPT
jgi:hypothetical protein